jgi:HAMP domain-containing protein
MPLLTEIVRLVQLGNQVDQGQLTEKLPEKYEVVQQEEVEAVEAEEEPSN